MKKSLLIKVKEERKDEFLMYVEKERKEGRSFRGLLTGPSDIGGAALPSLEGQARTQARQSTGWTTTEEESGTQESRVRRRIMLTQNGIFSVAGPAACHRACQHCLQSHSAQSLPANHRTGCNHPLHHAACPNRTLPPLRHHYITSLPELV